MDPHHCQLRGAAGVEDGQILGSGQQDSCGHVVQGSYRCRSMNCHGLDVLSLVWQGLQRLWTPCVSSQSDAGWRSSASLHG